MGLDIEKVLDKLLKICSELFEKNYFYIAIIVFFIMLVGVLFLVGYTIVMGDPFPKEVVEVLNDTINGT